MKLRLHGNSIRLRLSRSEVERFRETGRVEEAIQFADGSLVWSLESSSSVQAPEASCYSGLIRVLVPAQQGSAWAASNEVGIYSAPGAPGLAIVIEKDFACLHNDNAGPRDDADAFPNPAATHTAD